MKVVALLLLMILGAWANSVGVPQQAYLRKCRRSSLRDTGGIGCMANFRKWRYDDNQRKCVSYSYGGCFGTDNLFNTEENCQEVCRLMKNAPPCGRSPVGVQTVETGCQRKWRQKLEDGCFEEMIHCPNRQPSGPCQPVLHAQHLPPDCQYMKVTGVDGCSRSVINCSP